MISKRNDKWVNLQKERKRRERIGEEKDKIMVIDKLTEKYGLR